MANYETVVYEKVEDKIFRLTLNRPEKLNAMSQKLLGELDLVMSEFEANDEASVLIIRGAGRAFCAGYDLQPTQRSGSGFTVHSDRLTLQKMVDRWQRLWSLPKPVIAQVHGYCLAGATELVGHCDIVFASEDAQFGHPAGRSADSLHVAHPDGSEEGQGILLHWRLHERSRGSRLASRESRDPKGQA